MAKYVLEEYVINGFNASSKAREDVSKILLDYGYQSVGKNDKRKISNSKIKKTATAMKIYGKLAISLKKDDLVFLQTSLKVLNGILKVKKMTKFRIVYLIHDLFSLKYDDYEAHKSEIDSDIAILNQCEYVICHNSRMKDKLIEFGCTSNLFEIGIFDYLIDNSSKPVNRTYKPDEIAFAGNLSKSAFLSRLDEKVHDGIAFNIYGSPIANFSNLNYYGSVPAEKLPFVIKGNYGLIWEGEYEISEEDNYTRFNNPHKASLYIVSGLPLIVWSKAAISDFVKRNRIGIVIDSLDELEDAVKKISEEEYAEMKMHCKEIREKLMRGYFLRRILDMFR